MKNGRKGISSTSPKATARLALAALLAAALALPLAGCFGIPDPDEIAGKAEEAAPKPRSSPLKRRNSPARSPASSGARSPASS